jgi:hypothetical protein
VFLDIFELHFRNGNICKLPRMRKQASRSRDHFTKCGLRRLPGFTSRQSLCLVEMRDFGEEPQRAGLKRCRETFHDETPSVTGMTSRS